MRSEPSPRRALADESDGRPRGARLIIRARDKGLSRRGRRRDSQAIDADEFDAVLRDLNSRADTKSGAKARPPVPDRSHRRTLRLVVLTAWGRVTWPSRRCAAANAISPEAWRTRGCSRSSQQVELARALRRQNSARRKPSTQPARGDALAEAVSMRPVMERISASVRRKQTSRHRRERHRQERAQAFTRVRNGPAKGMSPSTPEASPRVFGRAVGHVKGAFTDAKPIVRTVELATAARSSRRDREERPDPPAEALRSRDATSARRRRHALGQRGIVSGPIHTRRRVAAGPSAGRRSG